MITKYQDFLTENNSWTENDPEYYGITEYKWNNGYLDCYQNVNIRNYELSEIPLPFGKVHGNFECDRNCFYDLTNSPSHIFGDYYCVNNWLTSLKGCPEFVKGKFSIDHNPELKTIDYFPKEIRSLNIDINIIHNMTIEDYPLTIINFRETFIIFSNGFSEICKTVFDNVEKFRPLLDDKVKFHQMIMRLKPELIPLYTTIQPPTKKSILFNI